MMDGTPDSLVAKLAVTTVDDLKIGPEETASSRAPRTAEAVIAHTSGFKGQHRGRRAPAGDRDRSSATGDGTARTGPASVDKPVDVTIEPSRLARNLAALAGSQVITWTMTLIWTLVVPRALGPAGLGMIVSAQSVTGILSVLLGFGATNFLVREMVVDRQRAPSLVGTTIVMRLALTPVIVLAAVIWGRVAHFNHEATAVLYLITAMTVFTLLTDPFLAAFQAIERMQYIAYGNVILKSAQSLIGIALVLVGFRAIGIAASMAAVAAGVFALSALWLRRYLPIDVRTNIRMMAELIKHSAPYLASGMAGMIYFWIDTLMLSLMTNATVVGWYGAAMALFQTLMFLPNIMSGAWLPGLVRAFTNGGHQLLVRTARIPLEAVLAISLPVAAGTAMVAPELVHAVYGPSFARAVPVLVLLAFCVPPIYLNIMLNQVLVAAKRQVLWTYLMIGAAVVNPLLNLVLIPLTQSRYHNGAIGASISLVLTEALMDAAGFVIVGRQVFSRVAVRRCALAAAASAGMWSVAYAARPVGTAPSLAAGAIALILLTIVLRVVTPDEIALMKSGLARIRRRQVPNTT